MSIILSLVGDGVSDDLLAPVGYRQVARISGKDVVRIFGTRKAGPKMLLRHPWLTMVHLWKDRFRKAPRRPPRRETA